jgi:hypothetical protein
MFMRFRRAGLVAALALGAMTIGTASAEARDGYYRGRGNNDAAIAIGAGVVGLALGAAIASSNRDRFYDRYYYDDYYRAPPRFNRGYPRGRYFDRPPRRFYDGRYDRRWNGNWNRNWDRGRYYGW